MKEISRIIARHLLSTNAVKLSPDKPFQWASGWLSPIYCDNRITLSYPEVRNEITNGLKELIKEFFPDCDILAGVATAGIPQASILADRLNMPLIYVRPNPKSHGLKNQIEGRYEKGLQCVVVEDLISTGGSSLKAVDVLRAEGVEVIGLISIFTYGFPEAEENFQRSKLKYHCLSDYSSLIEEALKMGLVKDDHLNELKQWRDSPSSWKK